MTSQHICPRCGYDLSGETSRWEEACPLRGRCPECGTEFEWELIFRPERFALPWFVEHAPSAQHAARRWLPTLMHVLWPPRFWREVTVTRPVNPTKAVLWLALPCLVLHVVASVTALGTTAWYRVGPIKIQDVVDSFIVPFSNFDWLMYRRWWPTNVFEIPAPSAVGAATCTFAVVLLLLPWTRRLAKLRTAHLIRATSFSLWWVILLFAFRVWRNLDVIRTAVTPPGGLPIPGLPPGTWVATVVGTPLGSEWPQGLGFVLFAWTLWWWWCACNIGWRVDRGRWVWALLAAAASIAALIFGVRGQDLIWLENLVGTFMPRA